MLITENLFWEKEKLKLNVRYASQEDKSATETLVFLHDALGSIPQWKGFPERLAQATKQDILVYERQGHGSSSAFSSPRDVDYMHQEAKILANLLEDLNIKSPTLIGHSDGGSIALLYAASYPTKLIVAIAAHVFVEEICIKSIRRAFHWQEQIKKKLKRYHQDKTNDLFSAWHDTWVQEAFHIFNIEQDIKSIQAPLLIIQGDLDEYGTYAQVERIKQAVFGPVEDKYLRGVGHMPHLESPTILSEEISKFIKKHI